MSILVSGGAGYIGSHTCVELINAGYDLVVADDLVNSSPESLRRVEQITGKPVPFVQTELCNPPQVEELFRRYPDQIAAVIVEPVEDGSQYKTSATRPTENKETPKSYTVVSGDTLWGICKKHLGDGALYPQIAKLNGISNPNLIYPGQVIRFE